MRAFVNKEGKILWACMCDKISRMTASRTKRGDDRIEGKEEGMTASRAKREDERGDSTEARTDGGITGSSTTIACVGL